MRILVDIRHLNTEKPSGVGEYTIHLLRALFDIDKNNEYVLLSSGSKKHRLPELDQGTRIHIPTPNKLLNLQTLLLHHPVINWHAREPIDLIFLPNLNITTLPTDIPTVLTIHDLSWKLYPEFYSHKMQLWHKATRPNQLVEQASAIIAPSESTSEDLQTHMGVDSNRVHTVHHGFDKQFSHTMRAQDHGVRGRLKLPKQFALHVGTIEPRKNLLTLVEAVKTYREKTREDLHLVMAGSWGWRSHDLRRRLWKQDTKSWVHVLDYVPHQDLPALYRSAAVTVCPSIYEGFGLPALESMACGTPVIATHTSSLPEVTNDAAILIDPYNRADITCALEHLLGSNMLRSRLIEKGLSRAKQFSWSKSAQQTLNIFEKLA
ncbi:MAG: glycosyltransferase family 4 protein [Parcubacteria group bacterium]|nr:glycosyltransferase family 4 protein [Parcubacteria group bacterium]